VEQAPIEREAQRPAGAKQVRLSDDLVEIPRPHTFGQRRASHGRRIVCEQ
jgi:hypothetical protein